MRYRGCRAHRIVADIGGGAQHRELRVVRHDPQASRRCRERLACGGQFARHTMLHSGGCHCGNIGVQLRLSRSPAQMPLRSCSCAFCRSHGTRTVSDRDGSAEITASDWSHGRALSVRFTYRRLPALPPVRRLCRCGLRDQQWCARSGERELPGRSGQLHTDRRPRPIMMARRPVHGWIVVRRTGCLRSCTRGRSRNE